MASAAEPAAWIRATRARVALGIGMRAWNKLVADGRIRVRRIGTSWPMCRAEDVDRLLREGTTGADAEGA